MYLLRSVRQNDLNSLFRLARHLNSYNLPAAKSVLRKAIRDSEDSFRGRIRQAHRGRYLFVAEETGTGRVVGCSLVIARHGTPAMPHLSFELAHEKKRSRFLSREVSHTTLELKSDTRGFTELGGLTVLPRWRGREEKIGKQLSYARFAYLARHPGRFQKRLLVEYLPKLDPKTGNQLWGVMGQRFTGLTYRDADRFSAVDKEFILSLFPHEKIYADLLPDAVVQNLGVPGPGAKASVKMLEKLSFRFLNQIDPFDGGPHFGTQSNRVSIIRKTVFCRFAGTMKRSIQGRRAIVMRESGGEVRAVVTDYKKKDLLLCLPVEVSRVLGVRYGEKVSLTPFSYEI